MRRAALLVGLVAALVLVPLARDRATSVPDTGPGATDTDRDGMSDADELAIGQRPDVYTGSDCQRPTPTLVPGADLAGCQLVGADLAGIDLTGAVLVRADVTDADLTGADLSNASLVSAVLVGADLTGADLSRADLTGTWFMGVEHDGVTWFETVCPNRMRSDARAAGDQSCVDQFFAPELPRVG